MWGEQFDLFKLRINYTSDFVAAIGPLGKGWVVSVVLGIGGLTTFPRFLNFHFPCQVRYARSDEQQYRDVILCVSLIQFCRGGGRHLPRMQRSGVLMAGCALCLLSKNWMMLTSIPPSLEDA